MLETIFRETLQRCSPDVLIQEHLEPRSEKLWVFGAGKAAALMARGALVKYGPLVKGGVLIVPEGTAKDCELGPLEIAEGTHPRPKQKSLAATQRLLQAAAGVGADEHVIFVLSGGASSLLVSPNDGLSLEGKADLIADLMKAGAPISELNVVRKHLSKVKGGGLARMFKGKVTVLALSDVAGNSFSTIGSGPFCADPSNMQDALTIMKKWLGPKGIPDEVMGALEDTTKADLGIPHILVADGLLAARTAAQVAGEKGLSTVVTQQPVESGFEAAVEEYAGLVKTGGAAGLFIRYGEPRVEMKVDRHGLGGRSQHLALALAQKLEGVEGWRFLAAGTDGIDGPTAYAGAEVDGQTWKKAVKLGLKPQEALQSFSSSALLKAVEAVLETGATGNNLQDLHLLQTGVK